jgi:hypothetical protein
MAVSINTLKEAIKAAFDAEKEKIDDQSGSIDRIAEAIADAVATQIVQGINTAMVTLVLAAPNGPVTGNITITAVAS